MSDYNEAFDYSDKPDNPFYQSGHQIPGYPQYVSPYIIQLIQEYEGYQKAGIAPNRPIHRRVSYKEFLVLQRYWRETGGQPIFSMGKWIKDPFA